MKPDISSSIQFNTYINRLDYLQSMHYLEVPAEIILQLGGKLKIRLLCTVNNSLTFQCGLVALGNGNAYISINSKRMKQLKVKAGDEVKVALQLDESEYGMEMPEELAELLKQDEEGMERFSLLPPGKQRYIIYYVSGVKSSNLRLERALRLIENLKRTQAGKESFKEILRKE